MSPRPPTAGPGQDVPGRGGLVAALVLLAGLLLYVPGLGNHDLWAPDEPRYAQVAREMLHGGDWLLPHVNGRLYPDKPPGWFWATALISAPGGDVTPFTARLTSALAAACLLLLVAVCGGRMLGRRAGLGGALVLATSYAYFTLARSAHLDALLSLLVAAALFAAWRLLEGEGGTGARLVFWLAAGLGVLVKGPVGLILPLLVVLLDRLAAGDLRGLRRLAPAWGLPLGLAPSLLWLAAVTLLRPGYQPADVLHEHVLSRFSAGLHHPRPFYYHFTNFFIEMAPWGFLLPGAVLAAWRHRRLPAPEREDEVAPGAGWPARRFLLAWVAAILGFFTLSSEKRGLYILPLFPAAALLVGTLWDDLAVGGPARRVRRVAAGGLLIAAAVLLACGSLPWAVARQAGDQLTPELAGRVFWLAGVGLAGGMAVLATWLARRRAAALTALAGATAALLLVFVHGVEPAADPFKSARPLARDLARVVQPGDRVGMLHWRAAYLYYSGIRMDELHRPAALREWLTLPGRKVLLISAEQQEELAPLLDAGRVAAADGVGHRQMRILILDEPAAEASGS